MASVAQRLEHVWAGFPGVAGFLGTVDHKRIGKRYLITAFAFFVVGGIQSLWMRAQLAVPDNQLVSPQEYNELFTTHGTTMIFLFATPIAAGFGNYIVPLMLGTRDMAYPRVNAFSYWVYLFAGLFIYGSYMLGAAPDFGWFAYPPLTEPRYSGSPAPDFYALGLVFLGIGTTAGGINFIVTIFKLRAPGMSVARMPLYVWAILVTGFIMVFALPPLTLANLLLLLDRTMNFQFYDAVQGGTPVLWQHLFWLFGHPEVYLVFIPATGIVSMIVETFSRRNIAGYSLIVASMVAIGFISFGVWVHHMFTTGVPALTNTYFAAASMIIAVPSGIQFFAWLATMVRGALQWTVPMLYVGGFLFIFLLGGITGVMVASSPFDLQVHDSYFVVAHLHYVLIGGVVFPVFAGMYYWWPKITGRLTSRRLGAASFWLNFIGFNLTFFPQHILGLVGMPRRIYTYPAGLGWESYNMASTVGAFLFAIGIVVFLYDVVRSRYAGPPATDNPWGAGTLEWATTSPPHHYNFEGLPLVRSRLPLWDEPEDVRRSQEEAPRLAGALRETVSTSGLDSEPEDILVFPGDSYTPVSLALGILIACVGVLTEHVAILVFGGFVSALALIRWMWADESMAGGRL